MLPTAFDSVFTTTNSTYDYSTRFALKSTFHLPRARTNFGKFNIRYFGRKVWNGIEDSLKPLSFSRFKKQLKESYLQLYETDIAFFILIFGSSCRMHAFLLCVSFDSYHIW